MDNTDWLLSSGIAHFLQEPFYCSYRFLPASSRSIAWITASRRKVAQIQRVYGPPAQAFELATLVKSLDQNPLK